MAQVVCVGDLSIDFVPTATGTGLADAPAFVKAPGGAAANVAVGLARLGVRAPFWAWSATTRSAIFWPTRCARPGSTPARCGSPARPAPPWPSSRCAPTASASSCSTAIPAPTCCSPRPRSTPAPSRRPEVLHFDSISLASPNPRASSLFAADQARAAGHLVTYDVNLRLPLWPDATSARAGILEGLAKAQVVKLSDDELEFLTGSRATQAVRQLWHDGLQLVTLSRGSAGSTWLTATGQADVATHKVAAVDTTGAGDGFMAGLIHGLLADPAAPTDPASLTAICRFANATGALTTLHRGAIPALPTKHQVETFLKNPPP